MIYMIDKAMANQHKYYNRSKSPRYSSVNPIGYRFLYKQTYRL